MTGKRNLRRILAWILLVAMGVNNFAGSLSSVQATGYEQETTQENGTDIISTENTKSEEVTSEEKNTSTQELNVVQYETETEDENVQDQKNADVQGQTKSQTEEVVPAVETASTEEIQQLYAEDGVIDGNLSIYPPTILMCDLTVNGDINIYGNLDLNGHTLTVNGNVKQYVNFSLNGTMIVHGSYNWIANTLDFANGRLYIDQDMDITESGNKTWKMIEENAYLFVGGDIILGFYDKLVTNITAGTIELQGNFIQNIYVNERTIRLPECDFVAEERIGYY